MAFDSRGGWGCIGDKGEVGESILVVGFDEGGGDQKWVGAWWQWQWVKYGGNGVLN